MIKRVMVSLLVAVTSMSLTPAFADECSDILRDGTFSRSEVYRTDHARTVFASRLASMTTEEARRVTSGEIGLPIEGIPLQAGFSDEQFRNFQRWVSESVDLDAVRESSTSVVLSAGDTTIAQAWAGCMRQRGGLMARIEPQGNGAAIIRIEWIPYPGNPNQTPEIREVSITGGQVAGGQQWTRPGQRLDARAERIVRIQRSRAGTAIYATVSTDITDVSLYLPPVLAAPPAPAPQPLMIGACIGRGGVEGLTFWGPPSANCNNIAVWGKHDSRQRAAQTFGSCIGHGGVEGVTLYGPSGEACAGLPEWGTYQGAHNVSGAVCGCAGQGDILGGMILWGPQGLPCGGFPSWGYYDQHCVTRRGA